MLSTLIDRCGAVVAFIQSIMRDGAAGSPQANRPSGSIPRSRHDAMPRRSAELGQRNSDFQGEAPSALLHAYREATDDQHGEEMRRRSFVI